MKFAFFPGCKIAYYLPQYGQAARLVLEKFGVPLEEMEFNCCGYPVRATLFRSFILSAARNLALAEAKGLDILTGCKCCFGSFKTAIHFLEQEPALKDLVRVRLSEEGLTYQGRAQVWHLLQVLDQKVGVPAIKEKLEKPFGGLKIAVHYGCHALRPSRVTGFDDPVSPTLFDRLVEATGAKSVDWPRKLECCGAPQSGKNEDLSLTLTRRKLDDARAAGADYVCVACNYCQIQFDQFQAEKMSGDGRPMVSILYPQLLGLSLGFSVQELGLDQNRLDGTGLTAFFKKDEPEAKPAKPEKDRAEAEAEPA